MGENSGCKQSRTFPAGTKLFVLIAEFSQQIQYTPIRGACQEKFSEKKETGGRFSVSCKKILDFPAECDTLKYQTEGKDTTTMKQEDAILHEEDLTTVAGGGQQLEGELVVAFCAHCQFCATNYRINIPSHCPECGWPMTIRNV